MSGLEALALILPQSGRGLTVAEIETRPNLRGIVLGSGRLAALLYYLVQYQMVTQDGDRYLQAKQVTR